MFFYFLLIAFFSIGSMIIATVPPIVAVISCGIENIFEIIAACFWDNLKKNGIAILTIPRYKVKNLAIAAVAKATMYDTIFTFVFLLPIKYQSVTRTILPVVIKKIKLHKGPIPKNFAMIGDTSATDRPDIKPQVITEMINIRLTIEPVIKLLPKGAVAACKTTRSAIKIAVRVIQNILLE